MTCGNFATSSKANAYIIFFIDYNFVFHK
jgi:hypothetical protein